VSPRDINAGRFRLRVGVDVGAVAAGFEQRKTYRVLAGQECAAGEAAAVAGDPITLAVALDVELIGTADKFGDKSGHCDYGICFMTPNKSYRLHKPSSAILAGNYKNIIEDSPTCDFFPGAPQMIRDRLGPLSSEAKHQVMARRRDGVLRLAVTAVARPTWPGFNGDTVKGRCMMQKPRMQQTMPEDRSGWHHIDAGPHLEMLFHPDRRGGPDPRAQHHRAQGRGGLIAIR
jgi:hypothetical protein